MKAKFVASIVFSGFLLSAGLISCKPNTATNATSINPVPAETPEEIAQRLRREEAARQEQIRLDKLREEQKEKRLNYAGSVARTITTNLMKTVSPNSGKKPSTTYFTEENSYDYDTEKVILVFNSSWWGVKTTWADNPNDELHTAKCKLTVYNDGQTDFTIIEVNDVLNESIKFDQDVKDLDKLINQIDQLMSN